MLYLIFIIAVVAILLVAGALIARRAEHTSQPAGTFKTVNNLKLHYLDLDYDSGLRPVVLIHGASCSMLDMKTALGPLSDTRRLIMIDRPGFGYSERGLNSARLADQAGCIAELLGELGVNKPIIIAQSFGTAVALSFALEYPDRLSGLLLLAPVSHRWPGGVAWYNHLALTPVAGHMFRHGLIPLYGHLFGRKVVTAAFWPNQPPENYFERANMPLTFRPGPFKSNAQDLTSLYGQIADMEDRYPQIDVPLRMLAGTHDTVVLATIHALALERKVKRSSLRFLPGTGHAIHHAAFSEIVTELEALEADIDRAPM